MVLDTPFMDGIVQVFLEISLAFVLELLISFSSNGVVLVVVRGRDTEKVSGGLPAHC